MKKLILIVGIIIAVAALVVPKYNQLVVLDENVNEKFSQVQNQYKRRADLVPNLVATVSGYAEHEKSVFAEVTEARSRATSVSIDASSLDDPEKLQSFIEAQNQLGSALSRLIAVSENYPQLKADQNFLALQNQLEGTENRIAVARKDYITTVKDLNVALRTFPTNIISSIFFSSIKPKANFEAAQNEQNAPTVSFEKK